jgi:hypothetical protein
MIFALLTLLTALGLAAVAGWFSIIGVMAIYAGAPMHALVMGVILEAGKLVTTSWLYRNWNYSDWKLKVPLIGFTLALMLATSIGVFGFLSKSHLEQGAKTIDNGPKVERLEQQIAREKAIIADNEKVISQLDATINSYLGKDRADRSVVIRRSQAPQRKQLRDEIDAANKRIDTFSEEKFKLQSELRELELEVGPIRYIAELIYGAENNSTKNIEGAVKIFTLLIVSTLDPLAVILLVAANHSIMRRQNEKKKKDTEETSGGFAKLDKQEDSPIVTEYNQPSIDESDARISDKINEVDITNSQETTVHNTLLPKVVETVDEEEKTSNIQSSKVSPDLLRESDSDPIAIIREILEKKPYTTTDMDTTEEVQKVEEKSTPAIIRSPMPSKVVFDNTEAEIPAASTVHNAGVPWEQQDAVIREILGSGPHFIPQKINEEEKLIQVETSSTQTGAENTEGKAQEALQMAQTGQREDQTTQEVEGSHISPPSAPKSHKYPKALSWLREFTRT